MVRSSILKIVTVGDIALKGRNEDCPAGRVLSNVSPQFQEADLVVANLECPLVPANNASVPGKCNLRGCTEWADILRDSGIGLVSLANNHMMDYGEQGLFSTMAALDKAGILYVGAGKNLQHAASPVFKKVAGRVAAILARSSVEVSSPCYATDNRPGVAWLDEDELKNAIGKCRDQADLVIVCLHWGMEHYQYPSLSQRKLARELAIAGADIILGHHPHVIQGEEKIGNTVVSYSSGNFLFDEFLWSAPDGQGGERTCKSTLTEENRKGMMLEFCIDSKGAITTRPVFTRISEDAMVLIDDSPFRHKEYEKLCSRLALPMYGAFWKLYSMKREWDLRFSDQLSPFNIMRKIHKVRPRHFKELAVKLRRSARVASEKSTNPYEG